jgi:riboflavin biosynthesis pyrimidine reductase
MTPPDPAASRSRRPHVICHMMPTVDGRIVTASWPDIGAGRHEYDVIAAAYHADAWMCGRISMEPFAGAVRSDAEVSKEATPGKHREDFTAPDARPNYAVAVDPSGRLAWQSNAIDGDHVIAVLTERVSEDYLAFLRSRRVSYLFAGARDVDLRVALEKLAATFGIRTLLLEGGGRINGAMLRDDLIDEVSVLLAPVADGAVGTPTLFDVGDGGRDHTARKLALTAVERRAGDVLWLRYRVEAR